MVEPLQSPTSLKELLGGMNVQDFLYMALETRPLYAGNAIAPLVGALLTTDQFESILWACREGVWVVNNGTARPVAVTGAPEPHMSQLYSAYDAGDTLATYGLQTRLARIANLCRDLEIEILQHGIPLAEPMTANAYLTPAHSQGFDIHRDPHCVFIMQLSGAKHWEIFSPPTVLPHEEGASTIDCQTLGQPVTELTLRPGDVLYIPRGFPHVARTNDESALHLTLSLKLISRADTFTDLMKTDGWFRSSLSPHWSGSVSSEASASNELISKISQLDIASYRRQRVAVSLANLPALPHGRLSTLDDLGKLRRDSVVKRVDRVVCISSVENDEAVLRFPGATLRLDKILSPVFDFVASVESFTANDLPTLADGACDALQLTEMLVRNGLVHLDSPTKLA
jgi:hypothetical protein